MPVVRASYQTGETLPALLQRDLGGTLQFDLEAAGVSPTITSGTCTLYDAGRTAITTGATTGTSKNQFAVSSSSIASEDYGMGYQAEWTFVISTITRTFRQAVGIVRFAPDCPVSNDALIKGRSMMTRWLAGTGKTTYDDWIEMGWARCQRWLARQGNRAHLVMDLSELYDLAEAFILYEVWSNLRPTADPDGTYARALADSRDTLKTLQAETSLTYDTDDSGSTDEAESSPARSPVVLCAVGRY